MASQIVPIVRRYSQMIRNGRTLRTIFKHTVSEIDEFQDEISLVERGLPEGKDGVVGEAIDGIACLLDAIFIHRPDITDEEIDAIMERKCAKWAAKYQDAPSARAGEGDLR